MKGTLFIVPALTDQAGQCTIVGYPGRDYPGKSALNSYRTFPHLWKDVGLMNSSGKLVCLDAQYGACGGADELRACEPLMAGLEFDVDLADPDGGLE
ncbi:uncharacterized protein NMK_1824 [Novimethylophilus kurashikiensis]|uniref:Uncharacterized protein n=1 Tax=Novimethylophilus kurashikiensis TaxID=1825523 RepID=A0A2R5F8W5_9PROT|nr:hypothetical protein [Novimethylophilus kurashikiensis]GBG14259.1 uncharacterized protein NMK_1824 [Novimethylophilus kurashikiensis]